MMTNKLFNSLFENALRLVILLDAFDLPQTLDKIYAVDFMAQYGKVFGISENNLNGDNPSYMYGEFASRRELTKEALKNLVLKGMVQPLNMSDGIMYVITPEGEEFCQLLDDEYAVEYRNAATKAVVSTNEQDSRTLVSSLYRLSVGGRC